VLVVEGLLVMAVLVVVVAGSLLPDALIALRIAPAGVLIAVLWVFCAAPTTREWRTSSARSDWS
jgi:hypothetical protein